MKAFKITLYISAWFLSVTQLAYSQKIFPAAYDYYELGLMFSQYDYTGSSRIQSLGGAQTALGADLSSALSNPAGLGLYNRSEFSLTPSINTFSGNSNYLNGTTDFNSTRFNIDQFGVAMQKNHENEIGFISGTLGISYTKVNKFNQEYGIRGFNDTNDILDFFTQSANQINSDSWPILTRQAFDVFLIDVFQDPIDTSFFYDRLIAEEIPQNNPVEQMDEIVTSGSQNQWTISYGANFKDVFFIGAGIGIQSIKYDIEKYYIENYAPGNILMDMNLLERLQVRGNGVNGNFGILIRPINSLLIGASVISPTFLTFSEISNISMQSNYDNYQYNSTTVLGQETIADDFVFEYEITTPARFNTGATVFISKNGFLTADLEFVNYANIRFDSQDVPLNDQEQLANSEFKNTVNYKFGGEVRFDKLRVRAGYALHKSPYVNEGGINRDITRYTAGLGYRTSKFFADFASVYQNSNSTYSPYTFLPEGNEALQDLYVTPVSTFDFNNLNFILTLGVFF